jgi:hypothetical protein
MGNLFFFAPWFARDPLKAHKKVACLTFSPLGNRNEKENLSPYYGRGPENSPCRKHEERRTHVRSLCQVPSYEISQVSTDDRFAALQLILSLFIGGVHARPANATTGGLSHL